MATLNIRTAGRELDLLHRLGLPLEQRLKIPSQKGQGFFCILALEGVHTPSTFSWLNQGRGPQEYVALRSQMGVWHSGEGSVMWPEDLHPSPGSERHLCGSQLPKVQNESQVPEAWASGWHVVRSLSPVRLLGKTENSWGSNLRALERNVTLPSHLWAYYSRVHYCLI